MPKLFDSINERSYAVCVSDLLDSPEVKSMKKIRHHIFVNCYQHSLFVSYVAFLLARRWGLDYVAAARAGLLHDLYLYDPRDKTQYEGNQCFAHPVAALKNASQLTELSEKEQNAILSHMWPLSKKMPHSREAVVVNLADKFCATLEVSNLYRLMKVDEKLHPFAA
jgi:uncharacterized protein